MSKLVCFFLFISFVLEVGIARAQESLIGTWKGIIYSNSITDTTAKIVYFKISKYKAICDIDYRIEKLQSTAFYVNRITGNYNQDSLEFRDVVFESKSLIFASKKKCNLKIKLIHSTGYMSGEINTDKPNDLSYKMILFKTNEELVSGAKKEVNQAWFYLFQREYLMGMVAPNKRDEERLNFKFESVYFDPAKSELASEYHAYLRKVINVINGHTDLRLKVIGHTDGDGSDHYNEALSKKRAETIIQFLEQNGLSRDRIEFEFQGEKKPVDSNKTNEGKKRNRRVDFQFI